MKQRSLFNLCRHFVVLAGVVCLLSATQGRSAEAILAYNGFALVGYADGGAGFGFSPNRDLAITQLGYDSNDLTNGPESVVLWDTNGVVLSSAVVTTNSSLFNWSRYETVRPVILRSGVTYFISGAFAADDIWSGRVIVSHTNSRPFTVSRDITYYGMALVTNSDGTFPADFGTNNFWPIGANFQYVTGQLLVVNELQIQNGQIQLGLSVGGGVPSSLTLLEAEEPGGPWGTNLNAVVVTNIPGLSYTVSATTGGGDRFYRVRSP